MDVVYVGDASKANIMANCVEIYPITALERIVGALYCSIGLSNVMVYVKGGHDDLMQHERVLKHIYHSCLKELDYRTSVNDENKAAVRIVTSNDRTYVAQFERPLLIWKFVPIYKHDRGLTDEWTFEDAQQVLCLR